MLWLLCSGSVFLLGCPTDNAPLQQENLQLKKQTAKLESVVQSLQEGNKAIQQQIDLLNRDARQTQEQYEQKLKKAAEKIQHLSQDHNQENTHLESLERENKKLRGDARWLRTQREQIRKNLWLKQAGGKIKTINYPILKIIKATQSTLAQNGYTILASMQTDIKAVYVTNRKTSSPSSLELTGFRNQYLLSIEKMSSTQSVIWVKADFEKSSQNAHALKAGGNEIAEIEMRLIQEIQLSIEAPHAPKIIPPQNIIGKTTDG